MEPKSCAICATSAGARRYVEVPDLRGTPTVFLRCTNCGLVYVDEQVRTNRAFQPDPARDLEEQWGEQFPDRLDAYDERSWGSTCQDARDAVERQYGEVVRTLGSRLDEKDFTLVELGAARGYLLAEIAKHHPGARLIGVEPSPAMAAFIREAGFEVVNGVFEDGNFEPDSIDAVVGFGCFIQIRDPRTTLKQINISLKEGGRVLFDSPNDASLYRASLRLLLRTRRIARRLDRVYGRFTRLVYNPGRFYYYTPATYRRLLQATGFDVFDVRTRPPRNLIYGRDDLPLLMRAATRALSAAERLSGREAWVQVAAVKRRCRRRG